MSGQQILKKNAPARKKFNETTKDLEKKRPCEKEIYVQAKNHAQRTPLRGRNLCLGKKS